MSSNEFTSAEEAVKSLAYESKYDLNVALSKSIQRRVTQSAGEDLVRKGWAEEQGRYLFLTKRGFDVGCRLNG